MSDSCFIEQFPKISPCGSVGFIANLERPLIRNFWVEIMSHHQDRSTKR